MKRTIATVLFVGLCQIIAYGQKKYEMVVVKTDGSEIVFNVEDVARTFFRQHSGGEDAYTSCPDSNHPHMIDLGLPSGTKWACCNVGANAPEQYGNHFAWGETHTKSVYSWETYQYGSSRDNAYILGSNIAGTDYDVATTYWGSPWRMPWMQEIDELLMNCSSEWTIQNDVYGRMFTGPNGGHIFLPAAGFRSDSDLNDVGTAGQYWSSSLDGGYPLTAYRLNFDSKDTHRYSGMSRCYGLSVRPVR